MHRHPTPATTADSDWHDANSIGLAYAAEGAWPDAVSAFAYAAEMVGAHDSHEAQSALALVLGNLAQATFRGGDTSDGIRHMEQSCALRRSLAGDDAIVVARARADLGVMLMSAGRTNEALSHIAHAIACIESRGGTEDARLLVLVENGARMAIAASVPLDAARYVQRLHALHVAHNLPTAAIEELATRVTQLLPSAPDGRAEHQSDTPTAELPWLTEPPAPANTLDIISSAPIDFADIGPAGSAPDVSTPPHPASRSADDPLGFEVRYGTPDDTADSDFADRIIAPPASRRVPTPLWGSHPIPGAPVGHTNIPPSTAAEDLRAARRVRRPNFRFRA